jgi:hypothetical protein
MGRNADGQRAIPARVSGAGHVAGIAASNIAAHRGGDLASAERERVRVHGHVPLAAAKAVAITSLDSRMRYNDRPLLGRRGY